MKFILQIQCDSDAFEEGLATELGRILRETATRVEDGELPPMHVADINGDTAGFAIFDTEGFSPAEERWQVIEEHEDGPDTVLLGPTDKATAETQLTRFLNLGHDAYLQESTPS